VFLLGRKAPGKSQALGYQSVEPVFADNGSPGHHSSSATQPLPPLA
jgi:hypothetical protein